MTVTLAPVARHVARHAVPDVPLVPHDAPPAGLGYPAPTSYRRDPVTGVPTPPWGAALARRRPARTGAPLAVAVAGAAVGLIGVGAQLPGLVDAVTATTASTAPTDAQAAPAPAVVGQCATVVAGALDDTVTELGRTPSGQWAQVVEAREQSLGATYGEASREQRAYAGGADDILGWLREDAPEDYGAVSTRVAQSVAATCAS
ncbi:hypothetical protein [Actinomycetospora cinnamomea]|uniref:hypothetical protein n=1 Tax=Actinomycetospora cinnamomea TaxID=663609 RepID=UPI000E315ACA|nr:hypothetical protein [Actinomycetospora cinnamomea]